MISKKRAAIGVAIGALIGFQLSGIYVSPDFESPMIYKMLHAYSAVAGYFVICSQLHVPLLLFILNPMSIEMICMPTEPFGRVVRLWHRGGQHAPLAQHHGAGDHRRESKRMDRRDCRHHGQNLHALANLRHQPPATHDLLSRRWLRFRRKKLFVCLFCSLLLFLILFCFRLKQGLS